MRPGGKLDRWWGLLTLGFKRATSRATYTDRQRVVFSILGVAVAIGLLVIVTGVGIGLATGTTVYDEDVDYWIIPEGDTAQSPLVATDSPQFGSVHDTTHTIRGIEGVHSVTPVLSEPLRIEAETTDEYVLVIGIINSPGVDRVGGVSSESLTEGDPYYNNGQYNGNWTGDVVLSDSAAAHLEVTPGDDLLIAGDDGFTVSEIDEDSDSVGNVPTALVQLSELQSVTGADSFDQADQFVVGTSSSAVQQELGTIYPESSVVSRSQMTTQATLDSDLPLALAVTAFLVAIIIGTLFVVTTAGLEIVADKTQLATLSAIGLSTITQIQLVGIQTLLMTILGGFIGGIVGLGGIFVVNEIAMHTLTTEPIALFHPLFFVYGIGTAILIGLLSLPYLLLLTRQVSRGVPQ